MILPLILSLLLAFSNEVAIQASCPSGFLEGSCSFWSSEAPAEDSFTLSQSNYLLYSFWSHAADFDGDYFKLKRLLDASGRISTRDRVNDAIQATDIQNKSFSIVTICPNVRNFNCTFSMEKLIHNQHRGYDFRMEIEALSEFFDEKASQKLRSVDGVEITIRSAENFRYKLADDEYNTDWLSPAFSKDMFKAKGHQNSIYVPFEILLGSSRDSLDYVLKAAEYSKKNKRNLVFWNQNSVYLKPFFFFRPEISERIWEKISLGYGDLEPLKKLYSFFDNLLFQDMEIMLFHATLFSFLYKCDPLSPDFPIVVSLPEFAPLSFTNFDGQAEFKSASLALFSKTFHKFDQKYFEHIVWHHPGFKQTWHNLHKTTYNWRSANATKNAIVTFGVGISQSKLKSSHSMFFLQTVKKHHPNDDLIIYCDQGSINYFKQAALENNFTAELRIPENRMYGIDFGEYNNMMRGVNYFELFKENTKYRSFFLVDLLDINFQGNVFDDIGTDPEFLQVNFLDQFEIFKVSLRYDSWSRRFVISEKLIKYFGVYQSEPLVEKKMICGGTILGDPSTLLSLYTLVNNVGYSKEYESVSDQFFLVFFLHHYGHSIFPSTNYLVNGNKIFMFKLYPFGKVCNNCHLIRQEEGVYWANEFDRPPRVIHKLNRMLDKERWKNLNQEEQRNFRKYMELNNIRIEINQSLYKQAKAN